MSLLPTGPVPFPRVLEFSGDWGDDSMRFEWMKALLRSDGSPGAGFAARGWYVQTAKYLAQKWRAVAMVESFDPNESAVSQRDVRHLTFGLNYYLRKNRAKLMASYVIRSERVDPVPNNLFQVQFQYFLH